MTGAFSRVANALRIWLSRQISSHIPLPVASSQVERRAEAPLQAQELEQVSKQDEFARHPCAIHLDPAQIQFVFQRRYRVGQLSQTQAQGKK